jgi:long-chain acyl-CoA synthetase
MKEDSTIHKIFALTSSRFPERICLQMKKGPAWERWTYGEIKDLSLRIGAFLVGEGFKKGDFAAICLENRPEWAGIYLGMMAAGLACVPLDPQLTAQEIENLIGDCGAKALFISNSIFSEKGIAGIENLPDRVVILDLQIEKGRLIGLAQIKPAPHEDVAWPEVSPEDIASLIYTSGTTGRPKGVMLTHENFCSNFHSIDKLKLITEKDNLISILPLHHSYPFMVTLITPLFCRARVTYASSLRSDELLQLMRESGVTVLVGVPQLFHLFYAHMLEEMKKIPCLARIPLLGLIEILWHVRRLSGINLSKPALSKIHRPFGGALRFFACGGAKLNEEAEEFLVKMGFTVLEGYGLTETSPVATFNPLQRQKIGSVGRAIPDVELKIAEPDGEGVGEVAIKGPNVMKGYYKRKDETLDVLRDSWFYSGDLGYLDEDGYLYITGRKKELIVLSSGKNIYPEEIESHYAGSPYIKEICVLGIGDAQDERLAAVVVPDTEYCRRIGEVNLHSKLRWELENLSEGLPAYRRVMGFVIAREELPRTRLGKVKRHEVKNRYSDELMGRKLKEATQEPAVTEEDLGILSSDAGRRIIWALDKYAKLEKICPADHLELDLGIDSLGRVELEAALERALNIRIPHELMTKVFTVKELILAIENLLQSAGGRTGPVPQVRTEASWGEILKEKPPNDIIKKLYLSPGRTAILGTLLFSGILRLLFRTIWRLEIFGAENIPKNGHILCVNHASYLDAFVMAASVPAALRKDLFFVGFRAYFELFAIRNIIKFIRVIPIDPGTHLVEAMQACSHVLRNDKIICIFPEGQRSIDGKVKEFKKGVGILAKELNVPIVPACITGSYESWPRTKPFPRPHPIRVTFGRPFEFEELKREGLRSGARDDYEAVALSIREEVIKLKGRQ